MLERQDTEDMLLTVEELDRELEQEALGRKRNYLCEKLEPERFFPYLQSKQYLDTEDCELIRQAGTTKMRVNKMLDTLIKKSGPNPLLTLIKGIKRCSTTQKFVAEKLQEEHKRICQVPENVARREAILSRTQLFVSPPPYQPYDRPPDYQIDVSEFSRSVDSKVAEKSVQGYGYVHDYVGPNRSQAVAPPPKIPQHNVRPNEIYTPPPVSSESVNASHFETSDFPTVREEIVSLQAEKEQKFSADPEDYHFISISDQQNKMRKFTTSQSDPSPRYTSKWQHSPSRAPSEHDASVVSPRRSISPSHVEDSNVTGKRAMPKVDGSVARPKNFTSMTSCQSGSIQPSCFTSSSFGDESCPPFERQPASPPGARTPQGATNGWPPSPTSKILRPHAPHNTTRQFSSPLETIPSIEIASVPTTLTINSINIRRPPIEHDDTSIMAQNLCDDDDDSSLEISTDSDNQDDP